MITRSGLWLMASLALVSQGCTRHVRPAPKAPAPLAPMALTAALVINPELRDQHDRLGRYSTLGIGNTWVVDTGDALGVSLEQYLHTLFSTVSTVSSIEESRADVVLIASPVSVTRRPEIGPYALRFEMQVVAKDKSGEVGLSQRYVEDVQGSGLKAVSAGAGAAPEVLGEPLERAMASAFSKMGHDLRSALGPGK